MRANWMRYGSASVSVGCRGSVDSRDVRRDSEDGMFGAFEVVCESIGGDSFGRDSGYSSSNRLMVRSRV